MSPFIIHQDDPARLLAVEVHGNSFLKSLRLSRFSAQSDAPIGSDPIETTISLTARGKVLRCGPEDLVIEAHFTMKFSFVPDHEKSLASVDCRYEAVYQLRPGFPITAAHGKAFADGNALFQIWPFFREFLQNSLTRMGHPPYAAPFLVIRPQPKASPSPKSKSKK